MKRECYNEPDRKADICLEYCGVETCTSNFSMTPHIRGEYLIHYVLSGRGTFHIQGKSLPLNPGDVFLIRPGIPISYDTNAEDPFHFSWIAFSGNHSESILNSVGFVNDVHVLHVPFKYGIHERILECINILESNNHHPYLLKANLYLIFDKLSDSFYEQHPITRPSSNPMPDHIKKATAYIRMNYMNAINVTTITEFVGLERSYFSKIFHIHTGKTIQQYITSARIARAKELLLQTNLLVREISVFVGFPDEAYFSRCFKKEEGISPNKFRKGKNK